nr:iron-containing alcohol dehydrogenase family protein [Shouchella patagoniensis]
MTSVVVRGAPHEYIFEEDALSLLEEKLIARQYRRVLVVHGHASWEAANAFWPEISKVEVLFEPYTGVCSVKEIKRLAEKALAGNYDALIGVGGGKLVDLVKGAAHLLAKPYVLIPTLASNCAPWTPISVIYNDAGIYTHFDVYEQNASLLLIDPNLLITAPEEFFIAGIGDTLAKWYEADVQLRSMREKSAALEISYYAASLCKSVLLEKSIGATRSLGEGVANGDYRKVAEAIIMLGGMVGGFGDKYGRIAGAHSIHNGLTALQETHNVLHGNKVAYGILVQLALEENWNEIEHLASFYKEIGLPVSLSDLGVDASHSNLYTVYEKATVPEESIHVLPIEVGAGNVQRAIEQMEEWNKKRPDQM